MEFKATDYVFEGTVKKASMGMIGVGVLGYIISYFMDHTMFAVDYLVGALWLITIAVSGIFFLSVTGAMQASWLTPYKRVTEAMTKILPVASVMILVSLVGMHTYYEWTHPGIMESDPILAQKTWWLTTKGFIGRMILILAIWNFLAFAFHKLANNIETSGWSDALRSKSMKLSAAGLILFAFSICVAAFDWIMSIEPHWFSTIFGVYIFAGTFVSGISLTTLFCIYLVKQGNLKGIVNENHFHDMGKWMFGFSVFWAYIWVSQYLLIWYANIPEETEYYHLRSHHGWGVIFWANLIINFVTPFFVLMTRGAKRNLKTLQIVACILLFGHFFDMYLMVAPKIFHHHDTHLVGYGVVQLMQLVGMVGVATFITFSALAKRRIIPEKDPNLEEGIFLHQ